MIELQIKSIPIDPFRIAQNLNIPIISYSQAVQYGFKEQLRILNQVKADAFCYKICNGRAIIFYDEKAKYDRIPFTIAHEIGHIRLKHYSSCGIHTRYKTTKKDDPLEIEADEFAGELLRSPFLIYLLKITKIPDIKKCFSVTKSCAEVGSTKLNSLKFNINSCYKPILEFYRKQFFHSIYHLHCRICLYEFTIPEAKFCPICGSKSLMRGKGENKMIYSNILISQCHNCENEEIDANANYCKICGTYILNKCSSQECNSLADSNARFCIICGKPTIFSKRNLFKQWQQEKNESLHDLMPDIPF